MVMTIFNPEIIARRAMESSSQNQIFNFVKARQIITENLADYFYLP